MCQIIIFDWCAVFILNYSTNKNFHCCVRSLLNILQLWFRHLKVAQILCSLIVVCMQSAELCCQRKWDCTLYTMCVSNTRRYRPQSSLSMHVLVHFPEWRKLSPCLSSEWGKVLKLYTQSLYGRVVKIVHLY